MSTTIHFDRAVHKIENLFGFICGVTGDFPDISIEEAGISLNGTWRSSDQSQGHLRHLMGIRD
jgi:hypothetical protein